MFFRAETGIGGRITADCRQRRAVVPEALAGGGSGSLGGGKGDDWGRGGGGGDGGAGDDSSADQPNKGGFYWKGWADRVAADPEFPFKVLLEQVRRPGVPAS